MTGHEFLKCTPFGVCAIRPNDDKLELGAELCVKFTGRPTAYWKTAALRRPLWSKGGNDYIPANHDSPTAASRAPGAGVEDNRCRRPLVRMLQSSAAERLSLLGGMKCAALASVTTAPSQARRQKANGPTKCGPM